MLDQDDVDAIARRVVELVEPRPGRLLKAGELAERLGVTRAWVYAHARMLGAVRLGDGPRAPLRFEVEAAERALMRDGRPGAGPARATLPVRRAVGPGYR